MHHVWDFTENREIELEGDKSDSFGFITRALRQYVLKYLHFMCLRYVFIYVLLRDYVERAGPVLSFPLCCTLLGCDHKNRKT